MMRSRTPGLLALVLAAALAVLVPSAVLGADPSAGPEGTVAPAIDHGARRSRLRERR